jgi:hypothetical protein
MDSATAERLIKALKTENLSYRILAEKFDMSPSGLKCAVQNLIKKNLIKHKDILGQNCDKAAEMSELVKLREENQDLRMRFNAAMDIQNAQKDWTKIPKYEGSGEAVPLVMFSDWHMEETIRKGEVPGCDNAYNPEIAKRRAAKAAQGAAYLINSSRYLGKIDTAVLWLGGDFISGHIHEELMESNSRSPIKAVTDLAHPALASAIEHILANCNLTKLIIVCNYGNHGRITPRIRHKTGHDHSLEWMMYQDLKREFKGEKRIEWHIADAYHHYLRIFDSLVRFHHGDNIAYYGGVGGLSIPMLKAIGQWNKIQRCDLDVTGHYHQRRDYGPVLVNGSLCGFGAYAMAIKADYERPQQQFAVLQPRRGKTMTAEIFCD